MNHKHVKTFLYFAIHQHAIYDIFFYWSSHGHVNKNKTVSNLATQFVIILDHISDHQTRLFLIEVVHSSNRVKACLYPFFKTFENQVLKLVSLELSYIRNLDLRSFKAPSSKLFNMGECLNWLQGSSWWEGTSRETNLLLIESSSVSRCSCGKGNLNFARFNRKVLQSSRVASKLVSNVALPDQINMVS